MESAHDTVHINLATEANRLAIEIVRARRQLTQGGHFDAVLAARLSHCFDRLDDIAWVIGAMEVHRMLQAAAAGPVGDDSSQARNGCQPTSGDQEDGIPGRAERS